MTDFPEINIEEIEKNQIADIVSHLKKLHFEIKNLEEDKQKSEERLRELLKHEKTIDGQRSYHANQDVITVTTGYNRRINKDIYLECKASLNHLFNPIIETIDYKISSEVYRACLEYGTPEDRLAMSNFIITSDKKLHVSIKPEKKKWEH